MVLCGYKKNGFLESSFSVPELTLTTPRPISSPKRKKTHSHLVKCVHFLGIHPLQFDYTKLFSFFFVRRKYFQHFNCNSPETINKAPISSHNAILSRKKLISVIKQGTVSTRVQSQYNHFQMFCFTWI